ncbi:hypothetical protein 278BB001_247 [Bacillus phage 278BB001]|nr:hypothetical protein 278BB001_247 [Bacillus phage 278BB001]
MKYKYSADAVRKRQEEMHGKKYTKEYIFDEVMKMIGSTGIQGSSYKSSHVKFDVPHKYLDLKELKKAKAALRKEGYRVKEKDYSSEVELTVSWEKFDWRMFWVKHRAIIKFVSLWAVVWSLVAIAYLGFLLATVL